jgi:hypothetical protein
MNDSNKAYCIENLTGSMTRSASWRRLLQTRYPDDPRNGRAADKLEQLAIETKNLSDEAFSELAPFYHWSSVQWSEAVSAASRQVGFRSNVSTLPAFTETLVGILSEQNTAN